MAYNDILGNEVYLMIINKESGPIWKSLFFDIDQELLSKEARVYHEEVSALVGELLRLNTKIYKYFYYIRSSLDHFIQPRNYIFVIGEEFYDDLYSLTIFLEDYCFRLVAYRDKLFSFINHVYKLGLSETTSIINKVLKNQKVIQSGLDSELKEFSEDNVLYKLINRRHSIAHRLYYSQYKYFLEKKY